MDIVEKKLDTLKDDDELKSKRKLLIIISILLLAMSVSGAQLVEVNTFIFKINFSNTLGFSFLVFLGMLVLTIRYYSVAYPYHVQIYSMWADEMMKDARVFSYVVDGSELHPNGLLSNKSGLSNSIMAEEGMTVTCTPEYVVTGLFERSVRLYQIYHDDYIPIYINLREFDSKWTVIDYLKLLNIEFQFQVGALFRRPEFLEIILPYMISLAACLSFVFKVEIQSYLK